jgi:nitrate reductase (cytochrome), electron transfer subunit
MHVPERMLIVLALTVAVGGAIGFSIGIDPARYRAEGFVAWPREGSVTSDARAAEPARSYTELIARPWRSGPQAGWAVDGEALRQAFVVQDAPRQTERTDLRVEALEERTLLRAFAGAPPVIPHPTSDAAAPACLACHSEGARLGSLVARRIPHAAYASCTQCHVAAVGPFGSEDSRHATAYASRFEPLAAPVIGTRAWMGAPPTIPHSTLMRSECLACHGPGGRAGLRSSHPQRASCLQCHATDAEREQRAAAVP